MKIGLPSALITPYYITFWKTFFEELGLEVVESGKTTKEIVNKGVHCSAPDICAPIKIYTGHVVKLLELGVDRVYIPRFVSIRDKDTFCPKFLGLPDMLRCMVPNLEEKMITHHLQSKSDNIASQENYLNIGKLFTADQALIANAIKQGSKKWIEFRNLCCLEGYNCDMANAAILNHQEDTIKHHAIKIGVIGYIYNVYDSFISMDILNRLDDLGANTVTFEMLKHRQIEKYLKPFKKTLFWTFSNKLFAAAYQFFNDQSIDGIIHVTAFGCGPDSLLGKWLELNFGNNDKPFMTLRVDEHTGENHLQTRLEAFIDMIAKKKRKMECA